ncbi:MAG: hypothetical protein GQ563_07145 [Desulfuromusa sp.]|nr:hypothetical protein [Desulfuromusa sp.]
MKSKNLFSLFTSVIFVSSLMAVDQVSEANELAPDFLPNLPPWEIYEAPPAQISVIPPVYLDVDSQGNIYRQKIVRDDLGNYEISEELVTEGMLMEISSDRTYILEDREAKRQRMESFSLDPIAASSSTCPLPC